ncbi:MAG: hypothetical protein DRZ82_01540 [Thermoprotei archaeon]|nr:MAG: hypothetical protein DRZ82_01540 [Thermoprotei archaeon]
MSNRYLIYIGPAKMLKPVSEKYYKEVITSGSKNLTFLIVTNTPLRRIIPQIRDIVLNNIALGITVYIVSYGEFNQMLNHLKECIHNNVDEITSIDIYVIRGYKEYSDKIKSFLKDLNISYKEVVL